MVEAGCWKGGSSTKFSIICKLAGIRLWIFDSFEGVSAEDAKNEWEGFAGQYASPEHVLRENLNRYGEPSVCSVFKGWFSDTLAKEPVPHPIRLAYIDCDLAKGTFEAMKGIVPSLKPNAVIFTQDFHIDPVRNMLFDPLTWVKLGCGTPEITRLGEYLAKIGLPREGR
jgi:O-methyltransferase